jgi:hypothetical protein
MTESSSASSDAMLKSSSLNLQSFLECDSEIFFQNGLNIETVDRHILNKYTRYRLSQYTALNVEDYELWICIQIDFEKFTQAYFAQLSESTWVDFLVYCYSHEYWIDDDTVKNLSVNMMKTLNTEFDCQWALNQINWMKTTYNTLFETTWMRIGWPQGWVSDMSNCPTRSNPRVGQKVLSDGSGRVLAIVRRSNPTREIVRNLRLDKIR